MAKKNETLKESEAAFSNSSDRAELELSFEQAASELDLIVDKLNTGSVQLDEMISLFERGTLLSEHCSTLLKKYDGRIAKAMRETENKEG